MAGQTDGVTPATLLIFQYSTWNTISDQQIQANPWGEICTNLYVSPTPSCYGYTQEINILFVALANNIFPNFSNCYYQYTERKPIDFFYIFTSHSTRFWILTFLSVDSLRCYRYTTVLSTNNDNFWGDSSFEKFGRKIQFNSVNIYWLIRSILDKFSWRYQWDTQAEMARRQLGWWTGVWECSLGWWYGFVKALQLMNLPEEELQEMVADAG